MQAPENKKRSKLLLLALPLLHVSTMVLVGCGVRPSVNASARAVANDNSNSNSSMGQDVGTSLEDSTNGENGIPDLIDDPTFSQATISDAQFASYEVVAASDLESTIATAFAIESDLLATNAHVVEGIGLILSQQNSVAVTIQHETGFNYTIAEMWIHPAYNGNPGTSPDVGLLRINGYVTSHLSVADVDDIQSLSVTDELLLCGFPGDVFIAIDDDPNASILESVLEQSLRPRTTCLFGTVTSLRPFDASVDLTPFSARLLQHDIATTQGTSGSAILNSDGKVVAINAAATVDEAGLNRFAPRADSLIELLGFVKYAGIAPYAIAP